MKNTTPTDKHHLFLPSTVAAHIPSQTFEEVLVRIGITNPHALTTPQVPVRFRNGCNIGIACGIGSGGLECIDFDKADLWQPFLDTLEGVNPDLRARLRVWQETPSGGYHLLCRVHGQVAGNQKLASSKPHRGADGILKQDTWIETRGAGGQFVIAPSRARNGHGKDDGHLYPYRLHGESATGKNIVQDVRLWCPFLPKGFLPSLRRPLDVPIMSKDEPITTAAAPTEPAGTAPAGALPDDPCRPEVGAPVQGEETVLTNAPFFRSLFDHHAAVNLLIDPQTGRIVDANEAAACFYGWSRDSLRQMTIHQINTLPPEELHAALTLAALERSYHFEFAHRCADGSVRQVEVFASTVQANEKPLLFSIVHDITDRKQVEEALRQQTAALADAKARVEQEQRLLSAVLDALPIGMAITDVHGGTLRTNDAFERIWGGPGPETTSVADYAAYKAWWDATGEPVEPDEWASAIATRTGRAAVGQVMRLQRLDDSEVYVINSAAPVFDHNGQLAGCAVAIQDITALKCSEQALRDKTEDFNRAQEVGRIGSWRMDIRNNVLTWSDENYRIFGLPKGTPLRYETFLSIIHPDDRTFVDADWRSAIQSGTPYETEHRIIADGRVKWVREKAYLEFDDNRTLIAGFGITQDITERRKAEEALRALNDELERRVERRTLELQQTQKQVLHAEKLSAIGKLSASIAHEFNNPLQGILSVLYGLKNTTVLEKEDKMLLEEAIEEGGRIRDLIRSLQDFNRPSSGKKKLLDIHKTIDSVLLLNKRPRPQNLWVAL